MPPGGVEIIKISLTIRIGFGAYYTKTRIRNPHNPTLLIKAPALEEEGFEWSRVGFGLVPLKP